MDSHDSTEAKSKSGPDHLNLNPCFTTLPACDMEQAIWLLWASVSSALERR